MANPKRVVGGGGRRVSEIQQAHNRLWLAFSDAASNQGLRADADPNVGCTVRSEDDSLIAESTVFLGGWPYKTSSTKGKTIDIAFKTREMFASDSSVIAKATTQVGYFQRNAAGSVPLLELHYDFETPAQEAHPLFHAQLGSTNWPEERLRELGLATPISQSTAPHYSNARIPTAYMGFAQLLVALAADHLEPANFRLVVAATRGIEGGLLDPGCGYLGHHLVRVPVPHAHAWYDDRYLVQEWHDEKYRLHRARVLSLELADKDRDKLISKVMNHLGVSSPKNLNIVPR